MAESGEDGFTYAPIDQSTESFRLLRIRKGRGIMICCDLFQAHLTRPDNRTEAISYEALSYVWGSDKRERIIEINGKPFRVTINLYDALQQLQLPNQDRIVWVDAICINQNDNKERGHQVRHMSSIYKRAARVVYWLGSPTWMTNHCLNALRVLEKKSRAVARKDWSREQWLHLWDACRGSNRAQQREGLRDLLSRPWFERVWILQEVAHSHAAVVCCGKAFVSARIFGMVPFLMDLRPTRHCQAILDMMPGPFRQSSWFGEKVNQNLATLLDRFGDSKASDPRDLIFALLSMATDAFGHITQYYEHDELSVLETVFAFLFRIELGSIPAALRPTDLREFCGRATHYATIALERAFQDETSSNETTAFIRQQFPRLPIKFPTLLCAANYGVKAQDILDTLFTYMSPELPPKTWYPSLMKAAASNETAGEQAVEFFLNQTANAAPITEDILVAAANNHQKGAHLMYLFFARDTIAASHITSNVIEAAARNGACGEEVTLALIEQEVQFQLTENVLRGAASNTAMGTSIIERILTGGEAGDEMLRTNIEHVLNWIAGLADNGKISLFRQAASDVNGTAILKLLLDWIPIRDDPIAQQSLVRASQVSLDSVKLLVAHGADVNIRDMAEAQTTPLAAAVAFGRRDIVRFLLDNNADPCQDGSFRGASPIHLAVRRGFHDILALMLEQTAPWIDHCRDHDDWTPLHHAATAAHTRSPETAVVDLLIQRGASINTSTRYGIAPLLLAVQSRNVNMCRSLLDHNADIELGPLTPLAQAVKSDYIAVAELLLSRGANTEAELENRNYDVTLLMYAAYEARVEMVKLLLAYGSDTYKKVAEMNALQWAYEGRSRFINLKRKGHQLCIELLEKHMKCSPQHNCSMIL